MPIPGIDPDGCQRRNAVMAARGVETIPLRFFGTSAPVPAVASSVALFERVGELPSTTDGALARINALLPNGEEPLTADNVYVRYCEAASNSLIPDRWGFFDSSTLQNIAQDADAGRAFMNSHRTGSRYDSTPCELPY